MKVWPLGSQFLTDRQQLFTSHSFVGLILQADHLSLPSKLSLVVPTNNEVAPVEGAVTLLEIAVISKGSCVRPTRSFFPSSILAQINFYELAAGQRRYDSKLVALLEAD